MAKHEKASPSSDFDALLLRSGETRRGFLKQIAATSAALAIGPTLLNLPSLEATETNITSTMADPADSVHVSFKINGKNYDLDLDPRVTLLDVLRERLQLTGSKK